MSHSRRVFVNNKDQRNTISLIVAFLKDRSLKVDSFDNIPPQLSHNIQQESGILFVSGAKYCHNFSDVIIAICEEAEDVSLLNEQNKNEVLYWLNYVENTLLTAVSDNTLRPCLAKLSKQIEPVVFLVSNRISVADLVLFSFLNPIVSSWSDDLFYTYDNISRWYDNIQHLQNLHDTVTSLGLFVKIDKNIPLSEKNQTNEKKKQPKPTETKEKPKNQQKEQTNEKKKQPKSTETKEKPKNQQVAKETTETKDAEAAKDIPFSKLDMRIGKIITVKKHPDAYSLYVEQIDLGEGTSRNVVSGLVKHVPIEELQDRLVVVLCNVKPSKMRGVNSEAMVICASNSEHTTVEILDPPPNAQIGARLFVDGDNGTPEELIDLKSKSNIFSFLQPNLRIDESGIAVFKQSPLHLRDGSVLKAKTLTNAKLG